MTLHEALLLLNMDEKFGSTGIGDPGDLVLRASKMDSALLGRELESMSKHGVSAIDIFDSAYPQNLKRIASPPVVLYIKGELREADCDSVALVGTRKPTYYGVKTCEQLARGLAGRGMAVVSGLARGIDTAAHKGALKVKGGRTIAVLGNGLAGIYPPENRGLAGEIVQHGAVVSEFPMARQPRRHNFPRRNRVISGLSLGVIVVEAAAKSGSLITANFALEENREVFAVPGRAGGRESAGTHALLKQGARLVDDVDDVLEEIESGLRFRHYTGSGRAAARRPAGTGLRGDELRVDGVLSIEPMHLDAIAAATDIPVERLSGLLLNMQLKNAVRELPGKQFVRA